MRSFLNKLLLGWFAALVVTLSSAQVSAQERVAVLGFFGPNAGAARAAVRRVMAEGYEVVDMAEWSATAKRLGVRGQASIQIARVAQELGVKAVVAGGTRRVRRAWSVGVVIRDGSNGTVLGRQGATIRAPGRAAATAASIARNLMPFIDEADGASGDGAQPPTHSPSPDPEPDPPPDEAGGGDDYDMDFARDPDALETERPPGMVEDDEVAGQAADDEFPVEEEDGRRRRRRSSRDDEPDDDTGGERGSFLSRSSPHGFFDLSLEINITQRHFEVAINPLCDYRTKPRSIASIKTGIFSEIGVGFAFYPGALTSNRWWAHFGLEFSYRHHLVLKIINETQGTAVETSEQAIDLGVAYRAPVEAGSRVITITPRIGWGRYSFVLSDIANDIVPTFNYDHIYLGLNTDIPLVTTRFSLSLGAHYLAIISPGEEAVTAYNGHGLLPSSHGVQVNTGFSGQIYRGLQWGLGFEFYGFFTNNEGKGRGWGSEEGNSTLCDTTCAQYTSCVNPDTGAAVVGGIETNGTATDLIWRLVFQLSYRFGWRPEAIGRDESPPSDDVVGESDEEDEPLHETDDEDFEVVDDDDEDWSFE